MFIDITEGLEPTGIEVIRLLLLLPSITWILLFPKSETYIKLVCELIATSYGIEV